MADSPPSEPSSLLSGECYAIGPDCSHEEFLAVARVYARAVVDALSHHCVPFPRTGVDGAHRDMIQYGLLREEWSDKGR